MAKNHKWDGSVLSYTIPNGAGAGLAATATLDLAKLCPTFADLPQVAQEALKFAAQTAGRNATAGLFSEEPETAFKRLSARFKNWAEGVWKSASAGEGERKTSQLSQAIAEAGGISVEEAAQIVTDMIEEKVSEAGLSADEEGDKAAIRKIGAAVRSGFQELPEVAPILARIRADAALAKRKAADEEHAKAVAEGKIGSLASMLKKNA